MKGRKRLSRIKSWSGRPDSNRGPLAPKASALPGCATPRQNRCQVPGVRCQVSAPDSRRPIQFRLTPSARKLLPTSNPFMHTRRGSACGLVFAQDFKSCGPDFIGTVGSIPTHFRHDDAPHPSVVSGSSRFLCFGGRFFRSTKARDDGGVPTLARACRLTSFAALNALGFRSFRTSSPDTWRPTPANCSSAWTKPSRSWSVSRA